MPQVPILPYSFVPGPDPARRIDQYALRYWDTSNGLPQNSIQDIVQDLDGALWIATQEGLVRFDGLEFITFDRSNTPAIHSNDISSLALDAAGTLWAGSFSGGLIRCRDGVFETWTTADGLPADSITDLCSGAGPGVWVGTRDRGVFHFLDSVSGHVTGADGLPSDQIRCVFCDPDGALWVGTAAGLARIAGGAIEILDMTDGMTADDVTALAPAPDGRLWIGTRQGLNRLGPDGIATFTVADGLSNGSVQSLRADIAGTLWIGTAVGLCRLTAGGFAVLGSEQGLSADMVASLFIDRDGILWIGTHGGGLNMLRDSRVTGFTVAHGLTHNSIYTIAPAHRGGFWAGSFAGDLDRYRNGEFHNVLPRERLGTTRIRTLLEDRSGTLWIGTDVNLFRWREGRLTRCTDAGEDPAAPIRVIFEDTDGSILAGTDGAGVYRCEGDRLIPWLATPDLPSNTVRAILRDPSGRLWIGTYGGLCGVGADGCRRYTGADGLPFEYIRSLHATGDGSLWIGTYGGGLIRFRDDRFTVVTSADGLPSDGVYQIVDDRRGGLWMTSNTGLFRARLQELDAFAAGTIDRIACLLFTESDGMPSRECNGGSPGGLIDPDDRLWFPTLDGLAMIDPAVLDTPNPAPPAILDQITADGQPVDHSVAGVFPPHLRRLEFHFSAINFLAPERTLFRYRLAGFETDWIAGTSARIAQYTRLHPDDYSFELQASRDGSNWSESTVAWPFRIRHAFYQTALFYILCVLILGAAIRTVAVRRLKVLERNERILKQRVDEALAQVRTLSGLLPICAHCKKVRDDSGYWSQIEIYIRDHSDAEFSHGLCPDCLRELYPDFAEAIEQNRPEGRVEERPE